MSNPKRVWDSKKRAVRQWKEQVWLENWEKVVNTNHWFAEATWEDVVYDSSWEVAQEPLQTYDKWWEEIPWGDPTKVTSISLPAQWTVSCSAGEAFGWPVTYSPSTAENITEQITFSWATWGYATARIDSVDTENHSFIYIVNCTNQWTDTLYISINWKVVSTAKVTVLEPRWYVVNEITILYAP